MAVRVLATLLCSHTATAIEPLRVDGLVTAVVTPFDSNGSVALDQVPSVAKYLERTNVKTVFVGGTTGESLSLTLPERLALTEAWAKTQENIIVHVGAEAIEDSKALARHAAAHGAKALGCMPSVFFKPATVEIMAKWLQIVGAEAPHLPLYFYHIPSMTGSTFMMLDLIKAVEKVGVPSFAGVKYTGLYETRAFPDLQKCMAYSDGKYEIFCGREEMMTEALSVGVKGFIGSQPNVVGDLYNSIIKAWPHGNFLDLQMHALDFLDVQSAVPAGVNALKIALDFAGIDMGPARLPNIDADQATKEHVYGLLSDWCKKGLTKFNTSFEMCKRHLESQAIVV